MTTSLTIDEALVQEALALDNHSIGLDRVVEVALREYVQRRKRLKILELFGSIDYYED
ncbi:type II toxin-antitoxin system VapB family antitoxin [Prochlorothrix hollandica]|uniref:type II toxin-antitoxin system VapB family antitoxin n=1 Tax=Prochlorothrix hollandica TaxID=1223 RepID=UPI003340D471